MDIGSAGEGEEEEPPCVQALSSLLFLSDDLVGGVIRNLFSPRLT